MVILQIILYALPINVTLKNRPLCYASPQCVPLGYHPPHDRSSDSYQSWMESVNHAEHDKQKKHKADNPKHTSHRICALEATIFFE
jgi:hypothetical protein